MRNLVFILALLAQILAYGTVQAADWGWVLSVPHALSGDNVYKVRILEIDGEPQKELIRYAVPGGDHTVKVRMLLQVQWEPEFAEAAAATTSRRESTRTRPLSHSWTARTGSRLFTGWIESR
jgi:hypothetical protein